MPAHHSSRYAPVVVTMDMETNAISEPQPEFDMVSGQKGIVNVCPKCADSWATIFLYSLAYGGPSQPPVRSEFRPVPALCPSCGDGSLIGNYVHALSPWLGINPRFGKEVYKRELDIAVMQEENYRKEKLKEKEKEDGYKENS